MLRYFRINDPYRLVAILVIALLIYLPIFIDTPPVTLPELKGLLTGEKISQGNIPYAELVDSTPPLTCWSYGLIDLIFGRSLLARHILAFIIIFFQATYIGFIFIDKKAFSESTYIPSFIFIILYFFSFDTIVLSGELMGSVFLLLAISALFKEVEFRNPSIETVLNLGVYVGLASLFSFSYIVFLPAVCVVTLLYSRRNLQSFLLLLVGFCLPHALLISVYYLMDTSSAIWNFYYLPNLAFTSNHLINWKSLLILGAFPLAYLFISFIMLNREARFTKYQSQLLQIMFFWIVFSLLLLFYSKNLRPQSLIALIPPVTFFLTHLLLHIRRRLFAELNLWILCIGIIATSFLARYGRMQSIDYSQLIIKKNADAAIFGANKKILVLDDDLSYYLNNKMATPFLNWKLSETIFKNPDYFENVIKVDEGFENDPPDIIYDPGKYMKEFFVRIPSLKKKYREVHPGLYQKI